MSQYRHAPKLRAEMARALGAFEAHAAAAGELRDAAVAIVVTPRPEDGAACVLLTRRTARLRRHSGQFALPGGRLDPGETAMEAALRELHEEIGMALNASDVLGRLDDVKTRSGFRITPFVMWARSETITPDPGEVAACFHISLDELAAPDLIRAFAPETGAPEVRAAYLPTVGHEIYPPTAAMLFQFREVALFRRATRVDDFTQPAFTHR